jgi:hypothetical protein
VVFLRRRLANWLAITALIAAAKRRGQAKFPSSAANCRVGRAVAVSIGRLFNPHARPRKDFRAVFFLRKFFRNPVSFNVPKARRRSRTRDSGSKLQVFRRRNRAARKPDSAARQIRARRVAFGLPQDLSGELMFETCVNRRSSVSAFRDAGFRVERARSVQRVVFECAASN